MTPVRQKSHLPSLFEELAQAVRLNSYEEGYYSVMNCYLDESFDMKDRGVFVVGGYVARGVPIFELDRRWKMLRERPDINIEYFKASECENGRKQFAKFVKDPKNISEAERKRLDSISHEFLQLLINPIFGDKRTYLFCHGVGIVQADFAEVIKDKNAETILGSSPYRLAYDIAMIQSAWIMKQLEGVTQKDRLDRCSNLPTRDFVSFVCDEHQVHGPFASEAYRNLKKTNPNSAEYLATFSMADDLKCDALQAADAAAFEVRRALNLSLKMWSGDIRTQFEMLRGKIMGLITKGTLDQLLYIVNTHKPGDPFNLDALLETQLDHSVPLVI